MRMTTIIGVLLAATAAEAAKPCKGMCVQSEDGKHGVRITLGIQPRLDVESDEAEGERQTEVGLTFRRARVIFDGHVFGEDLTFKLQFAFDRLVPGLRDMHLDYAIAEGLILRAGQWKRPFSRQFINSGFKQQLIDRAITHTAFEAIRDLGVALHNETPEGIEYQVGLFNGGGEIPTNRLSFHPALVARVAYNAGDIKGYEESDLVGGPLRWSVGASVLADFDADDDDDGKFQAEVDFIAKVEGLAVSGAFYLGTAQTGAGTFDQDFALWGAHLQGGYLIGKHVEPTARYAVVDPDGPAMQHEILGGLAVYIYEHAFKWQVDAGTILTTSGTTEADLRLRTFLALYY